MVKKNHRRGQRGLIEADLVEGALLEIERNGLDGFSMRCAARAIGCDAATLIYHFGSKEGLERAVSDRLHGEIKAPARRLPWQKRLIALARHYRRAAQKYPEAFPLLLRFWSSGPRDLSVAEIWNEALVDAGLSDTDIPAVSFATYAAILGLCTGEARGMLGRPAMLTDAEASKLTQLPISQRLVPHFERLRADAVFEAAVTLLISGIEATYLQRTNELSQKYPSSRKH